MSPLPLAPASVLKDDGTPATGRYQGRVGQLDWHGLAAARARPFWWHTLRHKRWQYLGIGSADLFIGLAIVDLGWGCTAFAYLFDRQQRRLRADWSKDGLKGLSGGVSASPVAGAWANFKALGAHLQWQHEAASDSLTVSVRVPTLEVQASVSLADAPPLLLAVGPIGEAGSGLAHATQKTAALPVHGWARAAGQRFALDGAVASLDSSHGLLAHRTAWQWACAHRPGLGFNLQAGYFGAHENALWLDGQLIPLGAARFDFDAADPLSPWRVRTDDGLLDLDFQPEGARGERRNLGLVASRYVQPVGTFSGHVRPSPGAAPRPVHDLLGVTEDHSSRW
ncbi:MAG TPA: DUF2804 domain-containing protein [Candidatus Aquabacterium excrementipullorum]|nr:DUF2804 domain-containing protein [Candidatus Aquabacterium excrementipullorum]